MEGVECFNCPCLNNDADYGFSCNLGYPIISGLFGAYSKKCSLVKVVYIENGKEKEFTPEKLTPE